MKPSRLQSIYPPFVAPLGFGLLLHVSSALAQSLPPNAAAEETAPAPTVLTPFVVTTEGDVGYLAQNSLSGSRLRSNLSDLATPTTAFTAEFLSDVAVTNVDDLAEFMVSTKIDYPEGDNLFLADDSRRFRIRGLPAFNYSVNFFESNLRLDRYNTERIEQSRGPNSILFGLGSPGGVVNIATKKAIFNKAFGSVRLQTNSIDGLRTEIDYNQPLIKDKLSVRLALVRDHENSWRHNEYDHQDRVYATAGWQIWSKTRLDVETERGHVDKSLLQPMVGSDAYTAWVAGGRVISNTPNAAQGIRRLSTTNYPMIDTTTGRIWNWINKTASTTVLAGGVQTWLTDFSIVPKDVVLNGGGVFPQITDYQRTSAFLSHSFTPNLNIELAGNTQWSDHEAVTGRGGHLLNVDTDPTLPNGQPNPNAGRTYSEHFPGTTDSYDRSKNLRLSGAYTREFGRWFGRHQLAGLVQRDWIDRRAGQRKPIITTNPYNVADPQNGQNVVRFRTYFDLNGPEDQMGVGEWRTLFDRGDWRDGTISNLVDAATGRVMTAGWIWNAVPQHNSFERDSSMAILQSHWLDNRLVTVAGFRMDKQTSLYSVSDAVLARGPAVAPFLLGDYQSKRTNDPVTNDAENLTYSALFRVTKNVAVTYNKARNSALPDPNAFVVTDDGTGRPPSPLGVSEDIGLKFTLGKSASMNVLYYETSADKDTANSNAQIENRFPFLWAALGGAGIQGPEGGPAVDVPNKFNRYTFNSASEGYEVEFIANPTKNWRVFFNYSDGKVQRTNIGEEARTYVAKYRDYWLQGTNGRLLIDGSGGLAPVADDGDTVVETVAEQVASIEREINNLYIVPDGEQGRGQVRRSVNFVTNYSFDSGRLNGLFVGGGVRYRDGEVVAYNATTNASGAVTSEVLHGRANTLVSLDAGYRGRFDWLGKRVRYNIQLNVNNVLNESQFLPTRMVAGVVTTYRLQPPREWVLSTRFDF